MKKNEKVSALDYKSTHGPGLVLATVRSETDSDLRVRLPVFGVFCLPLLYGFHRRCAYYLSYFRDVLRECGLYEHSCRSYDGNLANEGNTSMMRGEIPRTTTIDDLLLLHCLHILGVRLHYLPKRAFSLTNRRLQCYGGTPIITPTPSLRFPNFHFWAPTSSSVDMLVQDPLLYALVPEQSLLSPSHGATPQPSNSSGPPYSLYNSGSTAHRPHGLRALLPRFFSFAARPRRLTINYLSHRQHRISLS